VLIENEQTMNFNEECACWERVNDEL
jgi:hypothetical protein